MNEIIEMQWRVDVRSPGATWLLWTSHSTIDGAKMEVERAKKENSDLEFRVVQITGKVVA